MTHSLVRGGSPIFLFEICKVLKQREVEFFLISEKDGPLRSEFERLGARVFIAPRAGPLESGLVLNMWKIIRRESAGLVHLNTFSSYYKYGLIAGRLASLPVIWGIREDVTTRRGRKLAWWIKTFATRIMPCTHEIASKLYPEEPPGKVRVIHDGIPPRSEGVTSPAVNLRAAFNIPKSAKLIGCVAALEPRKGIKELIEAFSVSLKTGINAYLICIGEDRSPGHAYQPMLLKRIDELGCAGRVHLAGGRADVDQLYAQFDLFVLATYWEGIARVLLEAAQSNCPIVTTDAGGNAELIHQEKGGLLVPPGDTRKLSEAMICMLSEPERAHACAEYSKQVVMSQFKLENCIDEILKLYRECLFENRGHS